MLDCGVSWPTRVGDHLIHRDAGVDDGALLNVRAGKQAAGLRRVNALARGRLLKRPSMTLILLFSGSSGASVLLSFMSAPDALGAPVLLIDAVAHEQHAEALGEGRRRWRCRRKREGSQPGQRHGDTCAAKHGSAGNAMGGVRFRLRHLFHLSLVATVLSRGSGLRRFRNCGLVTMVSIRVAKR